MRDISRRDTVCAEVTLESARVEAGDVDLVPAQGQNGNRPPGAGRHWQSKSTMMQPENDKRVSQILGQPILVGENQSVSGVLGEAWPRVPLRGVWGAFPRELRRYLLAGSLAFACDFSTLYVLTRFLGVNYLISAIGGFSFGLVVSYLTSRFWVFERRTLTNTTAETAIFSAIAISGLGLNEGILWIFQGKLGISYLFAKVVSGGAVAAWNFVFRKVILFR